MKNKLTKMICLLLTFFLVISCVIGCGVEGNGGEETTPEVQDSQTTAADSEGSQTINSTSEETTAPPYVKLQFSPQESKETFYGEKLSGKYLPFQRIAVSVTLKNDRRNAEKQMISDPETLSAWATERNYKGMEGILNLDPDECVILIFKVVCSGSDKLEVDAVVEKDDDLIVIFKSNRTSEGWEEIVLHQYFAVAVKKSDFDFDMNSGELFYTVYCEKYPQYGSYYYYETFPALHPYDSHFYD